MSCPLESDVLLAGTGAVSAEETARLHAHAARCASCGEALALVRRTASALRSAGVEARPDEVRRIERALVARRSERPWFGAMPAIAAAAVAGVVAILVLGPLREPEGEVLREGERVHVEAGAKLYAGAARVSVGSAADLTFRPGPELSVLELERGFVAISARDLEPATTFVVRTPAARIEVLAATFQLESSNKGTVLYVDEGRLGVTPAGGGPEQILRAGARLVIPPPTKPTHLEPRDRERTQGSRGEGPREPPAATLDRERSQRSRGEEPREPLAATLDRERSQRSRGEEPREPPAATLDRAQRSQGADRREPSPAAAPLDSRGSSAAAQRAPASTAATPPAGAPPGGTDVERMLGRADAARLEGGLERALALYLEAADHPKGGPYCEEALLRAARVEVQLGRAAAASAHLARAAERFPRGSLLPERTALAASIARTAGRPTEAAAILEALRVHVPSAVLAEEHLEVARALAGTAPERARRLLLPLVERGYAHNVRARARAQLDAIERP